MKGIETKDKQINIKVSKSQYRKLMLLGGPTAVLERGIEREAGDITKKKQIKQQALVIIEEQQKRIQEVDMLIKEDEEREAEELRKKQAAKKEKEDFRNKSSGSTKKLLNKEEWMKKWKPFYLQRIQDKNELCEQDYNIIIEKMEFKTKEEAEVWLKGYDE